MSMPEASEDVTPKGVPLHKSGHIHVALAVGFSIVAMAWVSKQVLTEPISDLWLGVPPFVAALYGGSQKAGTAEWLTSRYWVAGILLATALVLAVNWN